MNWQRCGRELSRFTCKYYPSICLEGKTTETLEQYNLSPGQDINPRSPEYNARILNT
jgi:hypothetical protein